MRTVNGTDKARRECPRSDTELSELFFFFLLLSELCKHFNLNVRKEFYTFRASDITHQKMDQPEYEPPIKPLTSKGSPALKYNGKLALRILGVCILAEMVIEYVIVWVILPLSILY